jgi:hypothetical protein
VTSGSAGSVRCAGELRPTWSCWTEIEAGKSPVDGGGSGAARRPRRRWVRPVGERARSQGPGLLLDANRRRCQISHILPRSGVGASCAHSLVGTPSPEPGRRPGPRPRAEEDPIDRRASSVSSVQVVSSDGTPIRAWSSGSGIPVLLCNGLGASPLAWPALLAEDSGFQVVGWDYRGLGASRRPRDPARVQVEDHVADAGSGASRWPSPTMLRWICRRCRVR